MASFWQSGQATNLGQISQMMSCHIHLDSLLQPLQRFGQALPFSYSRGCFSGRALCRICDATCPGFLQVMLLNLKFQAAPRSIDVPFRAHLSLPQGVQCFPDALWQVPCAFESEPAPVYKSLVNKCFIFVASGLSRLPQAFTPGTLTASAWLRAAAARASSSSFL